MMKFDSQSIQISEYDASEIFYHQIKEENNRRGASTRSGGRRHSSSVSLPIRAATSMSDDFRMSKRLHRLALICFVFLLFNSFSCLGLVHTQEAHYYYTGSETISIKRNQNEDGKFDSFNTKNIISITPNGNSFLSTLENQSLNDNINSNLYSSYEDDDHDDGRKMSIVTFHPSYLDFKEQQIAIPKVETVYIINNGKEQLALESISSSSAHFYCSFFASKSLQPGANTTFEVYFLARGEGSARNALYINTNRGLVKYMVSGVGVPNKYGLKPINNVHIPINTSYTSMLRLHNPTRYPLQILEIYSSDDDLHLNIPSSDNTNSHHSEKLFEKSKPNSITLAADQLNDTLNSKSGKSDIPDSKKKSSSSHNAPIGQNLWYLNPYETRPVVLLRYLGHSANNHTAFICIRTVSYDASEQHDASKKSSNQDLLTEISFIVPVEIEVSDRFGLYSPMSYIDFGDFLVRPDYANKADFSPAPLTAFNLSIMSPYLNETYRIFENYERSVDLYLTNSANFPVEITDVYSVRHNIALNINFFKNLILPPGTHHLTKVAEVSFNPYKSKKASQNYGKLMIKTNYANISYQIEFTAKLLIGSIEFHKNQTRFFATSSEKKIKNPESRQNILSNSEETVRWFSLVNTLPFPVAIYNVTMNDYAHRFYKAYGLKKNTVLEAAGGELPLASGTPLPEQKSVFKVAFNKRLYLNHLWVLLASEVNKYNNYTEYWFYYEHVHKKLAKMTIHTNYTDLDVPLYAYDGELRFTLKKQKSEVDTFTGDYFEEAVEELGDIRLNSVELNSTTNVTFEIHNFNPIDVMIDNYEIKNLIKQKDHVARFDLKVVFLYYEPLDAYLYQSRHDSTFYRVYIRSNQSHATENIKIPAHSKLVANITISPSANKTQQQCQSKENEKCATKISSELNRYRLTFTTNFQVQSFRVEFKSADGRIDLISTNETKVSSVKFDTFPNEEFHYPIYIQSNFLRNLKISWIEFTEFGKSFSFKWNSIGLNSNKLFPDNKESESTKSGFVNTYGVIRPNATTFIGHLTFNSRLLCHPNCYLGLEPKLKTGSSIIDLSSVRVKSLNLNSLENLDEAFVYELWMRSLNFDKTRISSAFDLDMKLLGLFHRRFIGLNKRQTYFNSKLKIHVSLEPDQAALLNNDIKLKEPTEKVDDSSLVTYVYPIKFKFKWPHFIKKSSFISFPLTQIYSNVKYKNISLHNPSNSSVLIQVLLLDDYSTRANMLKMSSQYSDLFYESSADPSVRARFQQAMDNFSTAYAETDGPSPFSVNLKFNLNLNQQQQQNVNRPPAIDLDAKKTHLILLLEPFQSTSIQIKFKPDRLGLFQSFLILRNNLTILDVYFLQAEIGSAKLRIDDMPPLKSSVYFNGKHALNRYMNADDTGYVFKTPKQDGSLLIKMSNQDFQLCNQQSNQHGLNRRSHKGQFDDVNLNSFSTLSTLLWDNMNWNEPWSALFNLLGSLNYNRTELEAEMNMIPVKRPSDYFTDAELKSTSVRLKQGILLRNFFTMTNKGNSELIVYHMLLDGQPCNSKGFEIAYCLPFTVGFGVNKTAVIEIRYQPDFTLAVARKKLTLVTNIGDLDYLIEVRIPSHMLTVCHDSLPRPPLETFLLLLFISLSSVLLLIMLTASVMESKSIFQFHSTIMKRIVASMSFDEAKLVNNLHEFVPVELLQSVRFNPNNDSNNSNSNATTVKAKTTAKNKTSKPANSTQSHQGSESPEPVVDSRANSLTRKISKGSSSSTNPAPSASSSSTSLASRIMQKSPKANRSNVINAKNSTVSKKQSTKTSSTTVSAKATTGQKTVQPESKNNDDSSTSSNESTSVARPVQAKKPAAVNKPTGDLCSLILEKSKSKSKSAGDNKKAGNEPTETKASNNQESDQPKKSEQEFSIDYDLNIVEQANLYYANKLKLARAKQNSQDMKLDSQNKKPIENKNVIDIQRIPVRQSTTKGFETRPEIKDSSINSKTLNGHKPRLMSQVKRNQGSEVSGLASFSSDPMRADSKLNTVPFWSKFNPRQQEEVNGFNEKDLFPDNNYSSLYDDQIGSSYPLDLNSDLDSLDIEFRKLQQENQQQLKQLSYLHNAIPLVNTPDKEDQEESLLSPLIDQPELVNLILNADYLRPEDGAASRMSRSLSILSKRSSLMRSPSNASSINDFEVLSSSKAGGGFDSRSSSRSGGLSLSRGPKGYKTNRLVGHPDDDELDRKSISPFIGIGTTTNSSHRNSYNSTPTSDIWDLPMNSNNLVMGDNYLLDVDDEYNRIVANTENFTKDLNSSDSSQQNEEKQPKAASKLNAQYRHSVLGKTPSSPIESRRPGPIRRPSSDFASPNTQKSDDTSAFPTDQLGNLDWFVSSNYSNVDSVLMTPPASLSPRIHTQSVLNNGYDEFSLFGSERIKNEMDQLLLSSSSSSGPLSNMWSNSHNNNIKPVKPNVNDMMKTKPTNPNSFGGNGYSSSILSNSNQAWNSVLCPLNDFDSSISNVNGATGSSYGIKSIWSDPELQENKKQS